MSKSPQYIENKKLLIQLSKDLKAKDLHNELGSVNEALKAVYATEGHYEFDTYQGWKDRGKQVRRGEKALLFWGRPRKGKDKEKPIANSEDFKEYEFFPLAYLFSQKQVD